MPNDLSDAIETIKKAYESNNQKAPIAFQLYKNGQAITLPPEKGDTGMTKKTFKNLAMDTLKEMLSELIAEFQKATREWEGEYLSQNQKLSTEVTNKLRKVFTPPTAKAVLEVISILTDRKDVTYVSETLNTGRKMLVIIPTGNSNGHSYKEGSAYIWRMDDRFIAKNGLLGNHINTPDFRPATNKEIEKLLKDMAENYPSALIQYVMEVK